MLTHSSTHTAALTRHPETSSHAAQEIVVRVAWAQEDMLAFTYTLTGECARLQIPAPRSPTRIDGLWQHTCFEAFISERCDSPYWEYNFSPSREWALYHFRSYRERVESAPTETESAPGITTQETETRLTLAAHVRLPHPLISRPLRLALSAVIEEKSGMRSYWALRHPPGKPDFHHRDSFSATITPPSLNTTRRNPS